MTQLYVDICLQHVAACRLPATDHCGQASGLTSSTELQTFCSGLQTHLLAWMIFAGPRDASVPADIHCPAQTQQQGTTPQHAPWSTTGQRTRPTGANTLQRHSTDCNQPKNRQSTGQRSAPQQRTGFNRQDSGSYSSVILQEAATAAAGPKAPALLLTSRALKAKHPLV